MENTSLAHIRLLRTAGKILEKESLTRLKSKVSEAVAHNSRLQPLALHELELQKLVQIGSSFADMRKVLGKIYRNNDSPRFQARLVELAFLHGSVSDIVSVLKFLVVSDKEFYLHINTDIRKRILVLLQNKGSDASLRDVLLLYKNADLTDAERLYVFRLLDKLQVPSELLVYFDQYHDQIQSAAQNQNADINTIYLTMGKSALRIGYLDGCRKFLGKIDPQSPKYRTALRLLLIPPTKNATNQVLRKILAEKKWENRLILLDQYLVDAESKNPLTDKERPALNAVLEDPLSLVPRVSEAWLQLSKLLVRHHKQLPCYPNLYHVFQQHKFVFFGPGLDSALWYGFLDYEAKDKIHALLQGIACIHHYVGCGSNAEKSLWKGKMLVEEQGGLWSELYGEALRFVQKTRVIPRVQRHKMLQQLRVACPATDLLLSDVRDYLPVCTSRYVLSVLKIVVHRRQDYDLELKIIRRQSDLAHFRNLDLDRIWSIAIRKEYSDLAWLTASVLNARRALHPLVRNVWQICGEKRSEYPLCTPNDKTIKACGAGFGTDEQKFLTAFFTVGALIPSLFARLDPRARVYRRAASKRGEGGSVAHSKRIEKFLNSVDQLAPAQKNYYFSYDGMLSRIQQIPIFIRNVPDSVWGLLFVRLVERLSLNLWSWQLTTLVGLIDKVIPRFLTRNSFTVKAMAWLGTLTPEQRDAWNIFTTIARKMPDPQAKELLGSFICRLTTCMYQNHYQALLSLQLMQVPLPFIWNLEKFILSAEYLQLRKQLGNTHSVVAPRSATTMRSILT